MKKLLRATGTSTASSGEASEERTPARILKQVFGSFRSSTPSRQQSSNLASSGREGQAAVPKESSVHKHSALFRQQPASSNEPHIVESPGYGQLLPPPAVAPPQPTNQGVGNVGLAGSAEDGAGFPITEGEQLDDQYLAGSSDNGAAGPVLSYEQPDDQYSAMHHPPYESWDRYLSPTGHALAFMSEPPIEALDFSTEMLFQANVNPYGRPEPGQCDEDADGAGVDVDEHQYHRHPGGEEQLVDDDLDLSGDDFPQQGFTSDAGPIGRGNDAGGHLLSTATTQSRKSPGAMSTASQSIVSAAHAALLASNLARQPNVNLAIDYGSEIYLTDSSPIGQGQFGSVYRGVYAGKSVAIKLLPKMFLGDASPADVETFIQEAAVLSGVDHPNVVKFYGGSLSPPYVFIVEELMERSLADVLYKSPHEAFPLRRVPENILLDSDGTAKISDFGLARCKYQSYVKTNRREAGSLAYMAPECFDARMGKLTDRLDVFSFGVLLWVMLTRQFPWQGMRTHEFLQRMVIGGGRLAVPQDDNVCPLALRRLLSACWSDLPAERPSCEEIMTELERMLKYMPAHS
ncbi:hypothetical protein PLESTF_001575500 [Pleodorina starrii]|nr:hypothetical protein PLESTF_001575500 [Pleodorina starrii]